MSGWRDSDPRPLDLSRFWAISPIAVGAVTVRFAGFPGPYCAPRSAQLRGLCRHFAGGTLRTLTSTLRVTSREERAPDGLRRRKQQQQFQGERRVLRNIGAVLTRAHRRTGTTAVVRPGHPLVPFEPFDRCSPNTSSSDRCSRAGTSSRSDVGDSRRPDLDAQRLQRRPLPLAASAYCDVVAGEGRWTSKLNHPSVPMTSTNVCTAQGVLAILVRPTV